MFSAFLQNSLLLTWSISIFMNNPLSILSIIAICIFVLSAIPQILKLRRNKKARDISAWMSVLIATGNLLLLIRAISIHDFYFSLNYALQLALWLTIVCLIFVYRGTDWSRKIQLRYMQNHRSLAPRICNNSSFPSILLLAQHCQTERSSACQYWDRTGV